MGRQVTSPSRLRAGTPSLACPSAAAAEPCTGCSRQHRRQQRERRAPGRRGWSCLQTHCCDTPGVTPPLSPGTQNIRESCRTSVLRGSCRKRCTRHVFRSSTAATNKSSIRRLVRKTSENVAQCELTSSNIKNIQLPTQRTKESRKYSHVGSWKLI